MVAGEVSSVNLMVVRAFRDRGCVFDSEEEGQSGVSFGILGISWVAVGAVFESGV